MTESLEERSSVDSKKRAKLSSKSEGFEQFKSLTSIVVSSILLSFLMLTFVFRTYNVNGSSMRPTLTNGDRVVVNKFTKTKSGDSYIPKRGQIVVFNSVLEGKSLIKRVIALPGERISMIDGRFTVKNEQYPDGFDPDASYEDTLPKNDKTSFDEKLVPAGHIFVSGDNRSPGQSLDSRNQLGFVPIGEVVGSATLRYFPLNESGRLK
ncbi:MAG: signal peptidase [Patescibacteria group bacterium]|nr:signal peptidase [Patescibacteria group bacterium]